MDGIKELADALYRERVERARRMSPEEKFAAGPQLFDYCCRIAEAGIRAQFPEKDGQQVRQVLTQRLNWQRRIEQRLSGARGRHADAKSPASVGPERGHRHAVEQEGRYAS